MSTSTEGTTTKAAVVDKATIFTRAAEIVSSGWCQGVSALDSNDKKARWESDKAVRFCLVGAVSRAMWPDWSPSAYSELFSVLHKRIGGNPFGWNDKAERTQEQVVALLKGAAEDAYMEAL